MPLLPINTFLFYLTFFICFSFSETLLADNKARPDTLAPVSVMGDISYPQGEWIFSYRYNYIAMDGNLSGNSQAQKNEILIGDNNSGSYLVAPSKMTTNVHLLGLMYATSDINTLSLMLPYLNNSMTQVISPLHMMEPNEKFNTESQGIGDIQISSILSLEKTPERNLLLNIGLSLPTGSIEAEDTLLALPALGDTQLPFFMQLGSGTYDLLPGFTYKRMFEKRSWGTQVSTVIRLGKNDHGYTLGNRRQAQVWHAWLINKELSFSTRLNLEQWDNIDGDNRERKIPKEINMNNTLVLTTPTIDPKNQGGQRIDIGLGFNGVYGETEHRLGIELVIPVQQTLDGPQAQRDLAFTFGYQKAFD